jgi:hypothetical protein
MSAGQGHQVLRRSQGFSRQPPNGDKRRSFVLHDLPLQGFATVGM